MEKYYRSARKQIWKFSGTLDKFFGDAVLAIFSYPYPEENGTVNAIKFARSLIRNSNDILRNLKRNINAPIDTGTRVGITTGDLWVLGTSNIPKEISFVGNTINLAARLESNSPVNGILMDNITWNTTRDKDIAFVDTLELKRRTFGPNELKGQAEGVTDWEMPP